MNHFKFQSLAFYGVAIAGVLLLFKVVTAYGETHLQAPAPINGRYRLFWQGNLPNCLLAKNLVLEIQQSGIYLNAALLPAKAGALAATEDKPTLTGIVRNHQFNLSGTVLGSILCDRSDAQMSSFVKQVKIQSQVQRKNLAGKLTLNTIPTPVEFTAQQQALPPTETSRSH